MNQLIAILLCLAYTTATAQTKKIAFKSHSGSMGNFTTALKENLFDMENSNFGMAPQRDIITARLDSVIFISDSVAIMVTSNYCTRENFAYAKPTAKPQLWTAGREIVYSHPLFSRNHSLDSIKQVIKLQYNFKNPVEEVVFAGYDNKKKKYKNNKLIPVVNGPNDNNQSPFDGQIVVIISLIMAASLAAGLATWRFHQPKENKPPIPA